MDEFEKEYFSQLKELATKYQQKRRDLAKSRIKMFTAALCRQLIEEKEKFNLIIAAGNSGLFMTVIAQMVYESLGLELPQMIKLPIFRFKSDGEGKFVINDNSSLKHIISGKLKNIPSRANMLFIDDEIMRGLTAEMALDLILKELPDLISLRCLIIAENHFFEWHFNMPKVSINYFAYSRLIQGLNGNIGYFVPDDLFKKIEAQIPDVESYNHAMAIVVGGALKRKDEQEASFYDSTIEDICLKEVPSYKETKSSLIKELRELVNQAIEEYRNKEIQFRF